MNRYTDESTELDSLIDSVRNAVPREADEDAYYLVIVSLLLRCPEYQSSIDVLSISDV